MQHEHHGSLAAVADALRFTPSAVSQQLAVLEREAGLPLLERAGRGVRLTDAALVLVGHADALLERAELAQAELAAATGRVAGRGRIAAFQSVALRLAIPAMQALARDVPDLRCEPSPSNRCLRSHSGTSIYIAQGQAVTLLPQLVRPEAHPRVAVRAIAEGSVHRTIFAATRAADAKRPSVQALLAAVRATAARLGWPAPGRSPPEKSSAS